MHKILKDAKVIKNFDPIVLSRPDHNAINLAFMCIYQSADRKSKLFTARRNEDGNVIAMCWQKKCLPSSLFIF
ncbi:MAG: hypothetical protein ACLFT6_08185 [Bacteroidales bacterium]